MKKKFLTNLILLLFLNLLVKPFWLLGIDRKVQNVVGEESYGIYFALFNFSILFNILLDVGITNFNSKNIAQYPQLLQKHFSGILILRVLLGLVYLLITLFIAFLLDYQQHEIYLLLVLALNQFLASFVLYFRSNLQGLHQFKKDSFLSVLDRIIMIVICSILLWGGITDQPFKISWFVYAQTVAYGVAFLIAFFMVKKQSAGVKLKFKMPFSLLILRQSLPFAVLILLMFLYTRTDAVMLERLLPDGKYQTGVYAKGYRLLDAFNMIAYLFAVLLLPIFSRLIKEKSKVAPVVNLSFRLLFIFSVVVAITCFFYGKELMVLMYDHPTPQLFQIIQWLMLGLIAVSMTYVFGTLLTANNDLKWLNTMAISGVVINIVLNFILIPQYFAFGAVIATLITQFITCFAQIIMVKIRFNWKINVFLLLRVTAFGTFLFAFGKYVEPFENWLMNVITLAIFGGFLSLGIGLIKISQTITFIKQSVKLNSPQD